jgi:hypothetical protein
VILPGTKLHEICQPIWGRNWIAEAAKALGVSARTIHRLRKSGAGVSGAHQHELIDCIDQAIRDLESRIAALGEVRDRLAGRYE